MFCLVCMSISDSAGVLSTWERDDSACLHTVKQLVLMHKPPSPLILTPVHICIMLVVNIT